MSIKQNQIFNREQLTQILVILKNKGLFLFNPYSDQHSSFLSGEKLTDGLVGNITEGTLEGSGKICMYSEKDIDSMFVSGWDLLSKKHLEITEKLSSVVDIHSEWRVIARKK